MTVTVADQFGALVCIVDEGEPPSPSSSSSEDGDGDSFLSDGVITIGSSSESGGASSDEEVSLVDSDEDELDLANERVSRDDDDESEDDDGIDERVSRGKSGGRRAIRGRGSRRANGPASVRGKKAGRGRGRLVDSDGSEGGAAAAAVPRRGRPRRRGRGASALEDFPAGDEAPGRSGHQRGSTGAPRGRRTVDEAAGAIGSSLREGGRVRRPAARYRDDDVGVAAEVRRVRTAAAALEGGADRGRGNRGADRGRGQRVHRGGAVGVSGPPASVGVREADGDVPALREVRMRSRGRRLRSGALGGAREVFNVNDCNGEESSVEEEGQEDDELPAGPSRQSLRLR